MKIAVLDIYSGMVNRGVETVVRELAVRLCEKHQLTLFQGGKPGSEKYQTVQIPGIEEISTEIGSGIFSKLNARFYIDDYNRQVHDFTQACLKYLSKEKYSAILCFNGYQQIKVLKSNQSQHQAKIIYSNQAQFHKSIFKQAGWDNWMKLNLEPDVFVCLTEAMYQWAKQYAKPKTKIVKISNGVDLKRFNPKIKPIKTNLTKPIILCVAGLQKYKRVELLIRAVAKMNNVKDKSAKKKISLLVLGKGSLEDRLMKLGNKSVGRRHFKMMTVDYEQMPKYYSACDVFSLPSEPLEAFGVSYLEAMACNKPVVAPNDEIRREIIGEAGILTNVTDIRSYAESLDQAIKTDWKNKPRKQAEKFDWDKIVKEYEDLILE